MIKAAKVLIATNKVDSCTSIPFASANNNTEIAVGAPACKISALAIKEEKLKMVEIKSMKEGSMNSLRTKQG